MRSSVVCLVSSSVCVIGAGASGLALLRACRQLVGNSLDIAVFEKQSEAGGLWLYDWRTGNGGLRGEPVHGSMYRYLWSNGPKECLEFSDYSFLEHFGRAIPSYPPREVVLDYIRGRLRKQGVFENAISFDTAVRWVTRSSTDGRFNVTVQDLKSGELKERSFDFCVVASGHYSTPNVPSFLGIETFPGRVLHAHDFRSAKEFEVCVKMYVGFVF
jgi:trimethylamine monooxygenase